MLPVMSTAFPAVISTTLLEVKATVLGSSEVNLNVGGYEIGEKDIICIDNRNEFSVEQRENIEEGTELAEILLQRHDAKPAIGLDMLSDDVAAFVSRAVVGNNYV